MTSEKSNTYTTDEIAVLVKEKLPQTYNIKNCIDLTFDLIRTIVAGGGKVKVRSFGTFDKKTIMPTKRRNPRTGEKIDVAERVKIRFKGSRGVI